MLIPILLLIRYCQPFASPKTLLADSDLLCNTLYSPVLVVQFEIIISCFAYSIKITFPEMDLLWGRNSAENNNNNRLSLSNWFFIQTAFNSKCSNFRFPYDLTFPLNEQTLFNRWIFNARRRAKWAFLNLSFLLFDLIHVKESDSIHSTIWLHDAYEHVEHVSRDEDPGTIHNTIEILLLQILGFMGALFSLLVIILHCWSWYEYWI